MNAQYMQIGNAVPVALGKAIGDALQSHEAARAAVRAISYEAMLTAAVQRLRNAARNTKTRVAVA